MLAARSDISRRIGELSPAKLALLMEKLGAAGGEGPRPAIPRRQRSHPSVASFAQQRLWFLAQLEPDLAPYNYQAATQVLGRLERRVVAKTLAILADRHESLRTTFAVIEGELVQVISPHGNLPLPVIDLAALPGEPRLVEARRLGAADQRRPFDLERGPLVRATLLRLAAADHVVLLTLHHIISDAWSVSILVRELGACYVAVAADLPSPLPPLPIQYADFAAWERETLAGPALAERLDWWTGQLANAPAALQVPVDRPRSPARMHAAGHHHFLLPGDLLPALAELNRRESATLFVTTLAAFAVLLGWWSGDADLVVGSPIANRNLAATEGLIGFFVNILALRVRLDGDPPFVDLLRQARATCYGAFDRRDLPFEKVIEALQPARLPDRTPVFQVTFTLQNTPTSALKIPGLAMREFDTAPVTVKYDLMLDLWEARAGLDACFTYDRDLFDPSTIERLARLYETVLREIGTCPEARLSRLRDALTRTDQEVRRDQERAFKLARSERLRTVRRTGGGG